MQRFLMLSLVGGFLFHVLGCTESYQSVEAAPVKKEDATEKKEGNDVQEAKIATFGGGCFWCTEAVFLELKGVTKVESGYAGGRVKNPTYKQICTGKTGHAEVIQITYDPKVIDFQDLLAVFFATHDPTTLNRQGADVGTQYRSVVFYHDEEQKEVAEYYKKKLMEARKYPRKIVTEITKYNNYYPAEEYHQNFFARNPNQQYCLYSIPPKIAKLKKEFGDKLKDQ